MITIVTTNGSCTALGEAVVFDNCDEVTVTNDAPSGFLKGISNVIWTARDGAGKIATCPQYVINIGQSKSPRCGISHGQGHRQRQAKSANEKMQTKFR